MNELIEIILPAQDLEAQAAFYRSALGLEDKQPAREGRVEFQSGACALVLVPGGRAVQPPAPALVFRVADARAACLVLREHGAQMADPYSPEAGVWVCEGRDPEGNPLALRSSAADEPLSSTVISVNPGPPFRAGRRSWAV